jgi:hypothetical protein
MTRELQAADMSLLDRDQQAAITAGLAHAGTVRMLTETRYVESHRAKLSRNEMPGLPAMIEG